VAKPELASVAVAGRPSLAVVIVGVDGWKEYTLPAIRSIREHEPDVQVVVVDAASKYPYHKQLDYPDAMGLRLDPSFSYAGAINAGMAYANADWTIVLNNDVLCTGPFSDLVPAFAPRLLCGMQLIEFGDLRWLGGWIYAISRECREVVGPFDEQFEACGFEDLDYCIRARAAGFSVELAQMPFKHLWGKTRWGLNSYPAVRAQNMKRVEAKHGISIGEAWMWRVYE
jgi:GT2 family glycosyltransferase